jgi:hypothetical protein
MAKYDPLRRYLSRQKTDTVTLSFFAIEALISGLLPKGAARPEWWADSDTPDPKAVQKSAWRDAGFVASLLPNQDSARFDRALPE